MNVIKDDTFILGVNSQVCPKYPNEEVFISLQYLQKNIGEEVDSLSADKCKCILQVDSVFLVFLAGRAQS